MSLPLPDYNKKIHKGDISFVYKGVYHPIQWFGDNPYRPRVETIVIKNGDQIFLRMYDEKGDYEYNYRLPGGSLDNDSTKIKQAENEEAKFFLLGKKLHVYSAKCSCPGNKIKIDAVGTFTQCSTRSDGEYLYTFSPEDGGENVVLTTRSHFIRFVII